MTQQAQGDRSISDHRETTEVQGLLTTIMLRLMGTIGHAMKESGGIQVIHSNFTLLNSNWIKLPMAV
jgi:hypothetical protein